MTNVLNVMGHQTTANHAILVTTMMEALTVWHVERGVRRAVVQLTTAKLA